jgi:hypothetical protein
MDSVILPVFACDIAISAKEDAKEPMSNVRREIIAVLYLIQGRQLIPLGGENVHKMVKFSLAL